MHRTWTAVDSFEQHIIDHAFGPPFAVGEIYAGTYVAAAFYIWRECILLP